MLNIDVVSNHS